MRLSPEGSQAGTVLDCVSSDPSYLPHISPYTTVQVNVPTPRTCPTQSLR